jgi:hypothetical protein
MKLPPLCISSLSTVPRHCADDWLSDQRLLPAQIQFVDGWNTPANSDVRAYDTAGATAFLRDYSDDLRKAIDSPKCRIVVTKGCHQPGAKAHFTLSESGKGCNNAMYAGTKSVHIPC